MKKKNMKKRKKNQALKHVLPSKMKLVIGF